MICIDLLHGQDMQIETSSRQIKLSRFQSLSWPVKIRVRAKTSSVAPRVVPIFPASLVLQKTPKRILRSVEVPPSARYQSPRSQEWFGYREFEEVIDC